MKIIGRKREIKRITNFAVADPENKAFFGVKGIGKSTVFESVFSKSNCKMYAEEYQYLFVRTILSPDTKGDDLINFLIDRVINAIDLIDDDSLKTMLHQKLKEGEDKYYSKDSLLRDALETIKDYEYYMILIMDEFHNMGRNKNVGSEQYDFLRSLNELGLMYYWIVSDSDFSDVYATSQFTTSFFAQKFIPETMPRMKDEDMMALLNETADKYDVEISEDDLRIICSIIGGVPGFAVPAIKNYEALEGTGFDQEQFMNLLLEDVKCLSLLTSWSRSLTEEQKDILRDIAQYGKVYQKDLMNDIGRVNQLGDHSGLGLLVHGADENGKYWTVNSQIYEQYILRKSDAFYSAEIKVPEKEVTPVAAPTYIQNNYYTVNNNIFSPESAVSALMDLKRLVGNSEKLLLPGDRVFTEAVQQLPFQQEGWESLDDAEKDARADDYADKVFESGGFSSDSLSDNQMQRFHLTPAIMEHLSPTNRNNLISAIQVYDLLQFCIDRFGLNMLNSESARGILFAKLYESVVKDSLRPALSSVDVIASKELRIDRNTYTVADAPLSKMTLGNFVYILGDWNVQATLSNICVGDLGLSDCDRQWWQRHQSDMRDISFLRNDCCHSGNEFDGNKLDRLIKYLFELGAIADVEIYDSIRDRNNR